LAAACGQREPDGRARTVDVALDQDNDRIRTLENEFADLDEHLPTTAILPTNDHNFVPIVTTVGTFTLAIKDVIPYADGSRLKLMIGNPTAGVVLRFSMHLVYGPHLDPRSPRREQDFTASYPIAGGSRHEFDIDLAGIPPAQLGFVSVSAFEVQSYLLTTS
jgi:Protein of unknown function (DUF3251)